ncbi:MAG: hypothetical protein HQL24_08635 [Candidatus Omnitrophica bacterium]|nr:hypothetical protein [Candidatus Omnitrophota bacterium]
MKLFDGSLKDLGKMRSTMRRKILYIEDLTVFSYLYFILPFLAKDLNFSKRFYYFNGTKPAIFVLFLTAWMFKSEAEEVHFDVGKVLDKDNKLMWFQSMFDAQKVLDLIGDNADFQVFIKKYGSGNSLKNFLLKRVLFSGSIREDAAGLYKFIIYYFVIASREGLGVTFKKKEGEGKEIFFFVGNRPWISQINQIVAPCQIEVIPIKLFCFDARRFLSKNDNLKNFVKKVFYYKQILKSVFHGESSLLFFIKDLFKKRDISNEEHRFFRIAVDCYGEVNLDNPEMFSVLFFYQQSNLSGSDILACFSVSCFGIKHKELQMLTRQGIACIAVNRLAALTGDVPVFESKKKTPEGRIEKKKNTKNNFNETWMESNFNSYQKQVNEWLEFFQENNIKVHVTWFKLFDDHYAVLDAIRQNGGVGVVYQRSFENFVTPLTVCSADIVFGFSKGQAHIGRDKTSIVPYYVITGYLGDHRFGLVRENAAKLRQSIQSKGAERILTYFDENTLLDDKRWDLIHETTMKSYQYLLNKILSVPWLGIVIKPKVPMTLRQRLGPLADLLKEAEKTGRCIVFNEYSQTPGIAALMGDVAVHGHYFAGTAGVESALTGTPTLFMDLDGTPTSPLDKLGDRVIFRDWDSLWKMCLDHWKTPQGVPGFGDWTGVLDEVDPFRDGRAAERMGTYLQWLLDGFKEGLPRERVLMNAAERYTKQWGKDKIISINCSP